MEYEKLPQVQLRRIEKHVEEIICTKRCNINNIYDEEIKKIKKDTENKQEIKNYFKKEKEQDKLKHYLEKKYNCSFYSDYISMNYNFKDEKTSKKKDDALDKLNIAHKKFTEELLFGDKPSILKMIRDLEKL